MQRSLKILKDLLLSNYSVKLPALPSCGGVTTLLSVSFTPGKNNMPMASLIRNLPGKPTWKLGFGNLKD